LSLSLSLSLWLLLVLLVSLLLQSLRTYFYPSNTGNWTNMLSTFFLTFILQLCRHVGHTLASAVCPTPDAAAATDALPQDRSHPPLHLPTLQYLVTNLLPYCLEGLYSKNPFMTQYCSACIKNLVAVQPAVCGPIVMPFLLAALDPAAVSNAHQAPVAMQTLSSCFRPLMYPQPVILPYLPDILRLTLPGIEPSDVSKTSITLHLYSTILAWLPTTMGRVEASGTSSGSGCLGAEGGGTLPSYLDVIQQAQGQGQGQAEKAAISHGQIAPTTPVSPAALEAHLQALSDYIASDWTSALLGRFFAVLEAQEQLVEGAKPSPLAGAIGQCSTYLFQAMCDLPGLPAEHPLQRKQRAVRLQAQTQVRRYFASTTPLNGVKGCAKLLEAMVTADTSILPDVVAELLDAGGAAAASAGTGEVAVAAAADKLLSSYSADKVAFKLRLAGGACRAGTGAAISPSLAQLLHPILTSPLFCHHEEKVVRVATGKLLKDVLKGLTSIYPTNLVPVYPANASRIVGFPNIGCVDNVRTLFFFFLYKCDLASSLFFLSFFLRAIPSILSVSSTP
jgi:hypothetical protein